MLPAGGACPPEAFAGLLAERAPTFGVSLDDRALRKLARFLAELDKARRQTNLTGPFPSQELVDHALESVLGERLAPARSELVDIGSGAGFPGIPIAIVRPDVCVTPVEPRRKRAEFLKAVAREIELPNVFPYETSVTNLVQNFADVATERAVGRIDEILGAAPFLKPGGWFLAWTTKGNVAELARRVKDVFSSGETIAVPGSRSKVIASFRKSVPRGTDRPMKNDE